jgi:CheY-like chemotaxis protein
MDSQRFMAVPNHPSAILLVEDDEFVRQTTQDLLCLLDADVHTAVSGQDAFAFLTAAADRRIDLVITDLAMQDGDGQWLLSKIRSSPSHRGVKVIMMSAHAQAERIEAQIKAGADGYIVKPYDPDNLLNLVAQQLAGTGGAPARS